MKRTANRSNANQSNFTMSTAPRKYTNGLLSLAAVLLCGMTASASNAKVAAEQGFTIAPNVETGIVLKTAPDAACDLHATGAGDTRSMRFYANADGYVKLNASAREGMESRVQLDCSAKGKSVSYPLHLVASSTPTSDMPAPLRKIPTVKGSKVRPGLSEAQAQSMTDEQLEQAGYPARPNVVESPAEYERWVSRVAKPMTILPAHMVSRSDITATPKSYTSSNWSGLEGHTTTKHYYSAVTGTWGVPPILGASSDGSTDYSAFWVGLDGDGLNDLVQAGTEQDAVEWLGFLFTGYYAWSELLPNQPTEQELFDVDAGDEMEVEVWIGTGSGSPNPNGGYASYRVTDVTQSESTVFYVPLSGTVFNGKEAEWIMERPSLGGSLPELAEYLVANMEYTTALKVSTNKWVASGTTSNRNISMYKGKDELSEALWLGKGSQLITFFWLNFE